MNWGVVDVRFKRLYTVKELAEVLGCGAGNIYYHRGEGHLQESYQWVEGVVEYDEENVGHTTMPLFSETDVVQFLRRHGTPKLRRAWSKSQE